MSQHYKDRLTHIENELSDITGTVGERRSAIHKLSEDKESTIYSRLRNEVRDPTLQSVGINLESQLP